MPEFDLDLLQLHVSHWKNFMISGTTGSKIIPLNYNFKSCIIKVYKYNENIHLLIIKIPERNTENCIDYFKYC